MIDSTQLAASPKSPPGFAAGKRLKVINEKGTSRLRVLHAFNVERSLRPARGAGA
jgi:hypothetical protein